MMTRSSSAIPGYFPPAGGLSALSGMAAPPPYLKLLAGAMAATAVLAVAAAFLTFIL